MNTAKFDLALAIALWALAALVMVATAHLPVPQFEPIGPAFLPRLLAVGIALLAAVLFLRALATLRAGRPRESSAPGTRPLYVRRPGRAALLVTLAIGATALLHSRMVDFRVTAFLLITLGGAVLSGGVWSRVVRSVPVGLVLALSLYHIFTRVFVVDLP
jgi:hypothetical protein